MVTITIDGYPVKVRRGTSILDAARKVNMNIPTLCKHADLPATAACGICVVKIQPSGRMLRACCTPVEEGMEIITNDGELNEVRRAVLHLILSAHPNDCLRCGRNGTCELQKLAEDFGVRHEYFPNICAPLLKDDSTGAVVLDPQKCVKCGRCLDVCQRLQNVWALSFLERGIHTRMAAAGEIQLADSPCVRCGQCAAHCPTGAIFEYDHTPQVWEALRDRKKHCVVQIAPAVRTSLGEAFGYKPGELLTGKIYAVLRRLGFKAVFDTNFGADVTIMEEAAEFVERLTQGKGVLPLITTCCPSWVDYMEKYHHDMIPHFSSCKSPQAIVGVLAKTYYAQTQKIDPATMFMVSVMPCTAKKYEKDRNQDMAASGYPDVDLVITTRELARMIKQAGIDFHGIAEEMPDNLLGNYTGAGTIFGVTGGVMEAALRTAHNFLTGENPGVVDFVEVRGLQGIKESSVTVGTATVRVAIAHGLGNVDTVLERVRAARRSGAELPYHFIEVMACPGGCVGGGGQPYGITDELRQARGKGLYKDDAQHSVRCSHENPNIMRLYKEFLGKPLSEKSEHLLHTHYTARLEYKR